MKWDGKSMNWEQTYLLRVEAFEANISKQLARKLKIAQLKLMIINIFKFADDGCHDCLIYKSTIERMIDHLEHRGNLKEYKNLFCLIRNHLIREHKFVQSGISMFIIASIFMSIGIFAGLYVFDSFGMSFFISTFMGIILGLTQEMKLQKIGVRL